MAMAGVSDDPHSHSQVDWLGLMGRQPLGAFYVHHVNCYQQITTAHSVDYNCQGRSNIWKCAIIPKAESRSHIRGHA